MSRSRGCCVTVSLLFFVNNQERNISKLLTLCCFVITRCLQCDMMERWVSWSIYIWWYLIGQTFDAVIISTGKLFSSCEPNWTSSCAVSSDVNTDLGLKAKAKDLDPKTKDSRCQGQIFHRYEFCACSKLCRFCRLQKMVIRWCLWLKVSYWALCHVTL